MGWPVFQAEKLVHDEPRSLSDYFFDLLFWLKVKNKHIVAKLCDRKAWAVSPSFREDIRNSFSTKHFIDFNLSYAGFICNQAAVFDFQWPRFLLVTQGYHLLALTKMKKNPFRKTKNMI